MSCLYYCVVCKPGDYLQIRDTFIYFISTIKAAIYFIFFTISITYSACDTTRRIPSLKAQYKDIYIDQFKLTYLRKLLSKIYNNSTAVREIINIDHSGFTEPVLTEEDYKLIDSLTTIDNQNLIEKPDSWLEKGMSYLNAKKSVQQFGSSFICFILFNLLLY